MSDIRVEIKFNHLPRLMNDVPREVDRRVRQLAQIGRNYAVLSIQTPSPGETQTRYAPKRTVTAAAPGETPNTDTGALAGSITVQNAGPFQQAIAVGMEYGLYLEMGTPRMAARPFMGPMALWLEGQVAGVFRGLVS